MTDARSQGRPMRSVWRLIVVVALGLIAAATSIYGLRGGTAGYVGLDQWAPEVGVVLPGGPADKAGIRTGDEIDYERLAPNRFTFDPVISYQPPTSSATVPLVRGSRHFTVVVTPVTGEHLPLRGAGLGKYLEFNAAVFLSLVGLAIASWLVLIRPTVMTWSFSAFDHVAAETMRREITQLRDEIKSMRGVAAASGAMDLLSDGGSIA